MNIHLERLYRITAVLAVFRRLDTQATPTSPNEFCFGGVCYIRTSNTHGKNWTNAQQMCRALNATLPIVENPRHQESFEEAVRNLTTNDTRNQGIWIGAKALYGQPSNWTWLNGDKYYGTDIGLQSEGDYANSVAYLSIAGNKVVAIASPPAISYSYICHYPKAAVGSCTNNSNQVLFNIGNDCHVAYYTEKLSWFGARNSCLAKGGDLASFSNISALQGIIGHEVWVGLQNGNNYWSWYNAVTDIWSDVRYTLWKSDQPDNKNPTCISTDTYQGFPYWRDWNCTENLPFICQVVNTTPTTSEQAGNPSSRSYSTASSITVTTSAGSPGSRPIGSGIIPLAVGIGVGVGVPVIILIVVVIVIVVRRKHRNSGPFNKRTAHANSQSTKEFAPRTNDNNPEAETSEMNERENGPTQPSSSSSAQYATISEATRLEQDAAEPLPTAASQGIVYAPLSFDQ